METYSKGRMWASFVYESDNDRYFWQAGERKGSRDIVCANGTESLRSYMRHTAKLIELGFVKVD